MNAQRQNYKDFNAALGFTPSPREKWYDDEGRKFEDEMDKSWRKAKAAGVTEEEFVRQHFRAEVLAAATMLAIGAAGLYSSFLAKFYLVWHSQAQGRSEEDWV